MRAILDRSRVVLDRSKSVSDSAHTRLNIRVLSRKGYLSPNPHTYTRDVALATGGASPGWDIIRLFSPAAWPDDPQTEPQQSAHAAPGKPSPITVEDMSDHDRQEGMTMSSGFRLQGGGATLTLPPATLRRARASCASVR